MNKKQTLAFMLVVFFVITGIAASDYIGPNRSITTYVLERLQCNYTVDATYTDYSVVPPTSSHYGCHLTLYASPSGGCPSAGSTTGYFTTSACGWPAGVSCSDMACSPASAGQSTVGCNSGDPGCKSVAQVTNLPPATVAGTINCSNSGSNGWCRGSATSGYHRQ